MMALVKERNFSLRQKEFEEVNSEKEGNEILIYVSMSFVFVITSAKDNRKVAKELRLNNTTEDQNVKKKTGNLTNKYENGRPRITSIEDRAILLTSWRRRAPEIPTGVNAVRQMLVKITRVKRRFFELGIHRGNALEKPSPPT